MQTQTPTITPSTQSISALNSLTLDALAAMSLDELAEAARRERVEREVRVRAGAVAGRRIERGAAIRLHDDSSFCT